MRSVSDPRAWRRVRHPLAQLLAIGLGAVVAGARSFAAIGDWAVEQDQLLASAEATAQLAVEAR